MGQDEKSMKLPPRLSAMATELEKRGYAAPAGFAGVRWVRQLASGRQVRFDIFRPAGEPSYVSVSLDHGAITPSAVSFHLGGDGDLLAAAPPRIREVLADLETSGGGPAILRMQNGSEIAVNQRSDAQRAVDATWHSLAVLPKAAADMLDERKRQDAIHGGPAHDDTHRVNDWEAMIRERAPQRDPHKREAVHDFRERMVVIGALAMAAVEWFDRRALAGTLPPTRVPRLQTAATVGATTVCVVSFLNATPPEAEASIRENELKRLETIVAGREVRFQHAVVSDVDAFHPNFTSRLRRVAAVSYPGRGVLYVDAQGIALHVEPYIAASGADVADLRKIKVVDLQEYRATYGKDSKVYDNLDVGVWFVDDVGRMHYDPPVAEHRALVREERAAARRSQEEVAVSVEDSQGSVTVSVEAAEEWLEQSRRDMAKVAEAGPDGLTVVGKLLVRRPSELSPDGSRPTPPATGLLVPMTLCEPGYARGVLHVGEDGKDGLSLVSLHFQALRVEDCEEPDGTGTGGGCGYRAWMGDDSYFESKAYFAACDQFGKLLDLISERSGTFETTPIAGLDGEWIVWAEPYLA